jgi:hypothetical protein
MHLYTDNDTLVMCDDCGHHARRRNIVAAHGRHSRQVSFQTHVASLDEHGEVFARVRAFYAAMFDLVDELQSLPPDSLKLTYGRLVDLDLGAVMPSACARRIEIVPLAHVRVAGHMREIQLAPRLLEGATAEGLLDELKATAEPLAAQLNAQFEARDF